MNNKGVSESRLRVLYVHPCGVFGGASRSLKQLITAFPEGAIRPYVITPTGSASDYFSKSGIDTLSVFGISQFDHTEYSSYRGARWLIVLREILYMPPTIYALIRARLRWKHIDIIHLNEITLIPSLFLLHYLYRAPVIVHVRSLQNNAGGKLRQKIVRRMLARYAAKIIAIDENVKSTLPSELSVTVVHNGMSSLLDMVSKAETDAATDFQDRPLRIGFIGNLIPLKGIMEYLQAANLCAKQGLNVSFEVIGSGPESRSGIYGAVLKLLGLTYDTEQECRSYVDEHGLNSIVNFHGFKADVKSIYSKLDIVCFPTHLNAVGRPVIEAALMGVPSIVSTDDPREDTLKSGETGLAIPRPDPEEIAKAVRYFYDNPDELHRMGNNARELARKNLDIRKNALKVLGIYRELLAPKS